MKAVYLIPIFLSNPPKEMSLQPLSLIKNIKSVKFKLLEHAIKNASIIPMHSPHSCTVTKGSDKQYHTTPYLGPPSLLSFRARGPAPIQASLKSVSLLGSMEGWFQIPNSCVVYSPSMARLTH